MISLITCTGHRSEAFNLCHSYMRRQTYKGPLQWIVVSDQYSPEQISVMRPSYPEMELYAGPVKWKINFNTQRFNMSEALSHVKGDKILVIEDDEYYKPTYIEEMSKLLDVVPVAGEGNAKYFHLGVPGFKEMNNYRHASLCQTGLRKEMLPYLERAVDSGELYFDIHFWKAVDAAKVPSAILAEKNLCIGIKGMPGRENLGAGKRLRDYQLDPNLVKLKEWLGADADNYLPYIKKRTYERRDGERGSGQMLQRDAGKLSEKPRAVPEHMRKSFDRTETRRTISDSQHGSQRGNSPAGAGGSKTGR